MALKELLRKDDNRLIHHGRPFLIRSLQCRDIRQP
jgi:hypothetical protein